MRKRPASLRAVCLAFVMMLVFNYGVGKSDLAWAQETGTLPVQAKAAVLIDEGSGRVLYDKNSSERLAPASLTKIMTALLVLEDGDLDQKVYISRRAAETGESTVWLEPGEIFSRKELLYALLLSSANDAATALAESVAGTEDGFVVLMNRRAQELHLSDTHFSNAHGLDAPDHYTSAYDLAVLSRQAMANPFFRQIVATKTTTLPWVGHPWPRFMINKNRLLFRYNGAIGIKTGYTRKAGNCVIGAAERGNLKLIAVALDSPDVYGDQERLLDYGLNSYQAFAPEVNGLHATRVRVLNGMESSVGAEPDRQISAAVLPSEEKDLNYKTTTLSGIIAPVKKGTTVGAVQIFLKGSAIGTVNLVADSNVLARPTFWARLLGAFRLFLIRVF